MVCLNSSDEWTRTRPIIGGAMSNATSSKYDDADAVLMSAASIGVPPANPSTGDDIQSGESSNAVMLGDSERGDDSSASSSPRRLSPMSDLADIVLKDEVDGDENVPFSWMLVYAVAFAVVGGLAFGYDLGVMGGAELYIQESLEISDAGISTVVAAAKGGAVVGVLVGVVVFDARGRKAAFVLAGIFYTIGPLLLALAPGTFVLFLGRLLVGIGVGISSVVSTAYLGEIAPSRVRGTIIECTELALATGNMLALFVDFLLGDSWRWMVGLPAILGAILCCSYFVLPESPRWLVTQGKLDEALIVIRQLRGEEVQSGTRASPKADAELLKLSSETEREMLMRRPRDAGDSATRSMSSYVGDRLYELKRLWTGEESPQFVFLLSLAVVNQLCASSSVINYGPRILQAAGVDSKSTDTLLTTISAFSKLVGISVSMIFVDRVGRRKLLLWGSAACALAMAGIALFASSAAVVTCMCLFLFSFAVSHAGVYGVLVGESFSMHNKQVAFAATGVVLFFSGTIADSVLVGLLNAGRASFLIFSLVMIVGYILVRAELPETMGRDLSEVRTLFSENRNAPHGFFWRWGCACAHWNDEKLESRGPRSARVRQSQERHDTDDDDRGLLELVPASNILDYAVVSAQEDASPTHDLAVL